MHFRIIERVLTVAILSKIARHPLIAPAVLAGTVFMCHPLTTPAKADGFGTNFVRANWSTKVQIVKQLGGRYRTDCAAVIAGQRGATSCLHVTEASNGNGVSLIVRANMGNGYKQWCVADENAGRMDCWDASSRFHTLFVSVGGMWRSVN